MSQAVLALASALLGGLLVLVGDAAARRHQWRRELRLLLREKAEDWIALVNQTRSMLTGAREQGHTEVAEDLLWSERSRASTAFYSVPGAQYLDRQRIEVQNALRELVDALPDPDDERWRSAWTASRDAVVRFTDDLREVVHRGRR